MANWARIGRDSLAQQVPAIELQHLQLNHDRSSYTVATIALETTNMHNESKRATRALSIHLRRTSDATGRTIICQLPPILNILFVL
jgi:hypothetical protein